MNTDGAIANRDQFDYWNDQAGRTWADLQALLDRQIAPLGERALQALAATQGEHMLDIGCGCGDSALALARCVGPAGRVVGLDLSAPMLAVARARGEAAGAGNLTFVQADAQTARFADPFHGVFSRFGVMFFAAPVPAFVNIAACLRSGGRLAFVCWRQEADNIWMTAPLQAALRHLPRPAEGDPEAPGPFAFARADRVRGILAAAGLREIAVAPFDTQVGGFDVETALRLALRVGPLGRLLREAPDETTLVTEVVRAALSAYATADGVWMPAACWIVTARAP